MRKHSRTAALALVALLAAGEPALSDKPVEPARAPDTVREIFVPFSDLNVLLEGETHRVLLPRKEYEELLAKAKKTTETRAPRRVLLVSADYAATVRQERAEIAGTLILDVLEDGLHTVGLDLAGVGLRSAALDGKGAPIGLADDGRLMLFVEGKGRHELALEMVAPLQTAAARQILNFQLPTPPAARLRLVVPGDVEVKSGAAVVRRVFDEDAEVTRFELVPQRGSVCLVMTLNSRLRRRDRVVVARSVLVDEVTEGYERLHATVSMAVLHRAVDGFAFAVPEGFEMTDVRSPHLARWAMREEAGRRILDVHLRDETTDTVVLNLSAVRAAPDLTAWRLPQLEPLDVVGHVAVVGLLVEERLKAESLVAEGLIPIDTSVLSQAFPETLVQAEAGAARVRPVAAYYAPQPVFGLGARFVKPPARLLVTTNLLLVLEDGGQHVRGGFALLPEAEKLFALDFSVPAGWDVTRVTTEKDEPLPFERYGAPEKAGRIHVPLPAGVLPGKEQRLYFHAVYVPSGWLRGWSETSAAFPVFAVSRAARDVGAVAVDARDDMTVRPLRLKRLTPLDENEKARYGLAGVATNLAYRYTGQPYAATLTVERAAPRLTARTYSFFRIERDVLVAHYELTYEVARARVRRLSLLLPERTPTALSIKGLDGVAIKEYASEEAGGLRRWTALLEEARAGAVRLAVDFQQPLGSRELEALVLPVVRADGVAYQSGLVAVEGGAELDVEIAAHPRKVDIGELAEAQYQPGRRLLGAFGFVGEPAQVKVRVGRHPGYALPPAIVQRAEMATVVSADGKSQTAARFLLRTKALFLEVELPEGSTLWSATLDGKPAKPQSEDDSLLLNLPAADPGKVRDLSLVYETPVRTIGFWDRLEVPAPGLFLYGRTGGAAVPMADLLWHLHLPTGYRVVRSEGTVVTGDVPPPVLAASNVVGLLYAGLGGVDFGHGVFDQSMRRGRGRAMYMYMMHNGVGRREAESAVEAARARMESVPPAEPPAARPEKKLADKRKWGAYWALEGVRSLKIELQRAGAGMTFKSLGADPRIDVSVVSVRRLKPLAWALALAVLWIGFALTNRPAGRRAAYVMTVGLVATLLPVITARPELALLLNAAFYAASLLVPYYLLVALVRWAAGKIRRRAGSPTAVTAPALLLAVGVAAMLAATAQAEPAAPYVVNVVEPGPPVEMPEDAIILPYDPESKAGIRGADQLLLPYDRFVELWNLAYPDKKVETQAPPALYALAGAAFSAELKGDEYLLLEGHLDVDVYTDQYAMIPLPLEGGVLARADLDGKPARLSVVQVDPDAEPSRRQAPKTARRQARPASFVVLYASGKGRHRLELAVRMKLARRGGWRAAEGRLPAAPATALSLRVPKARTEVRLGGILDRQAYETEKAGEVIRTAVGPDGAIMIQWRPKVSEGEIDRGLTVESTATLDVQEDRLGLVWSLGFHFRRGERDFFRVEIPEGYRVAKVSGTNVRGWEVRKDDGRPKLEVDLLKRAKESERFVIHLWRASPVVGDEPAQFDVPVVAVPGALRHSGHVTIRRSPLLDLRTVRTSGVTRTDLAVAVERRGVDPAAGVSESPLGLRPYQAYRFVVTPFSVRLAVAPVLARTSATIQTILRLAERERTLETRAVVTAEDRPIHRVRLVVPDDLRLDRVSAPGAFEWAVTSEGGRKVLTLYLTSGVEGEVPVIIQGTLGEEREVEAVPLPRLSVLDVDRQQGDIVVQVDPAFDVRAEGLKNVESVLLSRVHGWLLAEQRRLARLALHYKGPDYSGRLVLTARKPDVTCYTVTNVRVTDRALEETILLDFTVKAEGAERRGRSLKGAGVREVSFLLPAWMKDASVSVPLLRQKTVEPVGDEAPDWVRVRLELQDELLGEIRVLVENDRLLTAEASQAPVPVVETGRTDRRYVAIESAGRDEVVVASAEGLEPLSRQQEEWRRVAGMLRGGTTQAYIVKPDVDHPRLVIRTKERAAVETVEARIGLAQTVLVLDSNGTYRAQQVYQVDNRTEQFLRVRLPEGASLWTVTVAGEPAKPVLVPDKDGAGQVRIPLVKTAAGDLDYAVALKYGGTLPPLTTLRKVVFPLVRTVNINVELSQVELYLPETHAWLDFEGTMREVTEGGAFLAGLLAYQNRLTQGLVRTLRYDNTFAQVRAQHNLKQLDGSLSLWRERARAYAASEDVRQELANATLILREADEEIAQLGRRTGLEVMDNTAGMRQLYVGQDNFRARNVVNDLGANWTGAPQRVTREPRAAEKFDSQWFVLNKLASRVMYDKEAGAERLGTDYFDGAAPPAQAQGLQMDQPQAPQVGQKPAEVHLRDDDALAIDGTARDRGRRRPPDAAVKTYQRRLEERAKRETTTLGRVAPTGTITGAGFTASSGMAFGGDDRIVAPEPTPEETKTGELTGLASLDVELPRQGVLYRFTRPRGEVEITARPASRPLIEGLRRLGFVVLAVLIVLGLYRLVQRGPLSLAAQRMGSTVLIILGALGFLFGIFPVAGVVALIVGIVVKIRLRSARRNAVVAA